MAPKGFQDLLKKSPGFFAFLSFTLGVFGICGLLRSQGVFDVFPYLQQYGWFAVPGLVGVAIIDRVFGTGHESRDDDDCMDRSVYVVTSSSRLIDEMYRNDDSVVKGCSQFLYVMGSRSRDKPYLDAIEAQLRLKSKISHVRLLVGQPHHEVLNDHIEELRKLADGRNKSNGDGTVRVCMYELGSAVPERFIAVSETKAVITLPSLNGAHNFDTALVIEDDSAAKRLGSIIRTLAQDCGEVYVGTTRGH